MFIQLVIVIAGDYIVSVHRRKFKYLDFPSWEKNKSLLVLISVFYLPERHGGQLRFSFA